MRLKDNNADTAARLADHLVERMKRLKSVVVAFSGGVDSATVAKAAVVALGDRSTAVTAVSPSLPSGELQLAGSVAREIGISHQVLETDELNDARYVANEGDRCYWCKTELYEKLRPIQEDLGFDVIANGTNQDDLDDYRPGLMAAAKTGVVSPLAECGLSKTQVRQLAKYWQLSVWDKPAGPCLSSRIAPGVAVTRNRLAMIDAAEAMIRSIGFDVVRVRLHDGELARIEVPLDQVSKLVRHFDQSSLEEKLIEIGFRYVTIDMAGFRSGSMNPLVQLESAGSR